MTAVWAQQSTHQSTRQPTQWAKERSRQRAKLRATARAVGGGEAVRPSVRTVFLSIVLVVLAFYTEMAFELEWRTAAGRIGPGFFPRLVGGAGIVLTALALVSGLRSGQPATGSAAGAAEPDLGEHPRVLLLTVLGAGAYVLTLTVLGAIVSSALFLLGTLLWLDRRHRRRAVVISLLFPVLVYLLLQTLLNAGLPDGILPLP
ncbi:MAG: tripartite tricarboxylate transporter TctB family protein [Nocardioidaceae bacterium]